MTRELTLDEIQKDIDLFLERADPAAMAAYEARILASQRNRPRTISKGALLDQLQRLRREKAMNQND
jgi:predicted dinucleotide-utilizing enzyme